MFFHLKFPLGGEMVGGIAHEGLESTGFHHPLLAAVIIIAEGVATDGDAHVACLTGLEPHFRETFEFLARPGQRRLQVADVELHHLGTGTVAGIRDGNGEGDAVVGGHLLAVGSDFTHLKGGVTQAVAEGEQGLGLELVGTTIAHEEPLLVFLVDDVVLLAPYAGEGIKAVGRHIVELGKPGEGELARRTRLAGEHIGEGVASLRTDEPPLDDGGHLVFPRHGDSIA